MKMVRLTQETAASFYSEHEGKPFFPNLIEFMTSDVSIGLELVREDAIAHWRALLGPTNSATAKEQAPKSIRGIFGLMVPETLAMDLIQDHQPPENSISFLVLPPRLRQQLFSTTVHALSSSLTLSKKAIWEASSIRSSQKALKSQQSRCSTSISQQAKNSSKSIKEFCQNTNQWLNTSLPEAVL